MLKYLTFIIVLLSISDAKAQGNEPYIPTKIQWAEVFLNSDCGYTDPETIIKFIATAENEITIKLIYSPRIMASVIDSMEGSAIQCVENFKELKGWGWLRHRVKRPR